MASTLSSSAARTFSSRSGPTTATKSGAHYGAAYLFMLYYAQHYGGYEAVGKLLGGDGRGEASFDQYLSSQGINATFESIFKDWVVANYLDDKSVGSGQYGYDPRRPQQADAETVRILPYRASTTVSNYGTHYYAMQPSRGDLAITFDGREDARLVDLDAHGGKVQWWSNRGDEIDSKLTRKVDLTGTPKATLKFWTWFDIEENYDYAFVLVSTDGGQTWTTIPGKYTTTDNPNGGNFGFGLHREERRHQASLGPGVDGPQLLRREADPAPTRVRHRRRLQRSGDRLRRLRDTRDRLA